MKKRYKRTFLVLYAFCSLLAEGVSAQSLVLSLEKTISLAADSSLEAFRTKNLFLSGYWEFRNYKAERLPSLTLNRSEEHTLNSSHILAIASSRMPSSA